MLTASTSHTCPAGGIRGAARRSRRTSQRILRKVHRRFFRMSTCIFSRTFSARRLDSSICSGVTGLAPGAVSLPAADAFTQLRSVCSTNPSSLAATTMPTAWARLTACSLNSAVYSCFGIFFISRPSGLDANHRPLEDEKRRAAHDTQPPFVRRHASEPCKRQHALASRPFATLVHDAGDRVQSAAEGKNFLARRWRESTASIAVCCV